MKIEYVPISIGTMSVDPVHLIPVAIAAVVVTFVLLGVKREFATFAIVAGMLSAFLTD
jgi:hypothetical protein